MFFMNSKKVVLGAILFFVFTGAAQANKMTKMQKVAHASPMPSLMMIVGMNASALNLTKEQQKVFSEWRTNNQQRTKLLVKDIVELEKEINLSVLDGIEKAEKDELKNELLELRGNLIDVKYLCFSNVKNTLTEGQWKQLMDLHARALRVAVSGNRAGNEIQAFLRVSPMPKLMAIILMHKKELQLTVEQNKYLEDWRLENMNRWALFFDQVLSTEKKITQQSLAMESNSQLMKEFDEMAKSRRIMAQMSLNCRDNIKKVLSDEQWKKMIKLFNNYI